MWSKIEQLQSSVRNVIEVRKKAMGIKMNYVRDLKNNQVTQEKINQLQFSLVAIAFFMDIETMWLT